MDHTIECHSCGTHIELTDALRKQLTASISKELQKGITEREEKLKQERATFEEQAKKAEEDFKKSLEEEKKKLWVLAQKHAAEKSKEEFEVKMKDLEEQNKEKNEKLKKMQEHELELRKKQRELEEKAKESEVALARKLDEEKKKLEAKFKEEEKKKEEYLRKQVEEEARKKMMEKDQQVLQLKKTIDELKRKSEQGSMQVQGDAQEENLKQAITMAFPMDVLEDVPTGMRGADLVHHVKSNLGVDAGVILWESKNTKAWNKEWIKKLKDDQAASGADLSVLATVTLPEGIRSFGQVDGVWVVGYEYVLPLASLLRQTLLEVSRTKRAMEGQDEKMKMLFEYLSGGQFKSRVENIVSAFTTMKEDLEAEKRAFTKHWARREKQIERVVTNTSGMYGDLEGIVGAALPQVEHLEVGLLGELPTE